MTGKARGKEEEDGYIHSVFDQYFFNPILFRESRHIMSQLNGDRLYCIDTSLSQPLINDTKHNKCVVGQMLKPSR